MTSWWATKASLCCNRSFFSCSDNRSTAFRSSANWRSRSSIFESSCSICVVYTTIVVASNVRTMGGREAVVIDKHTRAQSSPARFQGKPGARRQPTVYEYARRWLLGQIETGKLAVTVPKGRNREKHTRAVSPKYLRTKNRIKVQHLLTLRQILHPEQNVRRDDSLLWTFLTEVFKIFSQFQPKTTLLLWARVNAVLQQSEQNLSYQPITNGWKSFLVVTCSFLRFHIGQRLDMKRPPVFYLTIEVVVKQGFSVFWWWS